MNAQEYYSIIEQLKKFLYRAEEVCSIKDLDLLIAEFKNFIFQYDFLRIEYEKRINDFKKYQDEHIEEIEFISDKIVEFINSYHSVHKRLADGTNVIDFENCMNIPKIYYYSNLRYVMGKKPNDYNGDCIITDVTSYDGIKNFYVMNIAKYIYSKENIDIFEQNQTINKIEQFITNNISEITLKTVDFYAISHENRYILGKTLQSSDKLFLLWLNSALLQVLKILISYTKNKLNNLSDENNKEKIEKEEHKNTITFSEDELLVLKLRKNLTDNRYEKIVKKMDRKMSVSNIKRLAGNICNRLGADNIDIAVRIFEEKYYKL